MTNPEEVATDEEAEPTPLDKVMDLLHRVIDLLPWRQESDLKDAHNIVTEHAPEVFGRNAVPAGVQKPAPKTAAKTTAKDE